MIRNHGALVVAFLGICPVCLSTGQASTPLQKTTVVYRQVDGHDVLADVYRPDAEGLRPVIVWIHGGALIMGNRDRVPKEISRLAEDKGYAIVSIDYRLAPETKLPGIISDIEAAFTWIANEGAAKFGLDPSRIVVVGGSAGGYLTLVTGYRVTPRPKGLVALYGYGDLIGEWYSTPSPHPRHNSTQVTGEQAEQQTDGTVVSDSNHRKGNGGLIYLHYRQQGIWPEQVSGFHRSEIADKIAEFEPVRNVTGDYPPTLLIHGDQDTDVPYEESVIMGEQLMKHNVPHQLITIKNGEHGFGGGDPREIEAAYEAMQAFIVKSLAE